VLFPNRNLVRSFKKGFLGDQNCLLRIPGCPVLSHPFCCIKFLFTNEELALQTKAKEISEEHSIVEVVFNSINGFKYLEGTM